MIKRDAANASFHIPLLPGEKGKRGDKGDKKVKCNSDIYTKSYDEENGMRPCERPPNIRQRAAMPGGLYFF